MGTLKEFQQTLDENIDAYVEALVLLRKSGGLSEVTIKSLADLLKLAQSRTVDDFLSLGYDGSEQRPPKLEQDQHGRCISDGPAVPGTDVGG